MRPVAETLTKSNLLFKIASYVDFADSDDNKLILYLSGKKTSNAQVTLIEKNITGKV